MVICQNYGEKSCLHKLQPITLCLWVYFQVYEVKQSSSVVEKINSLISKVSEPLHPHVEENQTKNIKHLSYTFSREKQHL